MLFCILAPDVVPSGLKGWGSKKNNMEITWQVNKNRIYTLFIKLLYIKKGESQPNLYISQPLQNTERNGPNLRYVLWWRLKNTDEKWNNITSTKTKHTIHNTDTYVPYELKIQAVNDFGLSRESDVVIGYSGEDRE